MKKRSFSPQEYLASVFELDDFECFCIERLREKAESGREPALSKSELAASFFKEGRGAEKEEDAAQLMAAFWPDSPLMRYFLREERGTGMVSLDERMLMFLQGKIDGYGPYRFLWERLDPDGGLAKLEGKSPVPLMESFLEKEGRDRPVHFHLYGQEGTGRKSRIQEFCKDAGRSLFVMDGRLLEEENQELLGDILRECRIYGAFLLVREFRPEWLKDSWHRGLFRWMAQESGVLFTTGTEGLYPHTCPEGVAALELEIPLPDFAGSCRLWEAEFARQGCAELSALEWANKFVFTPGQIREAVAAAKQYAMKDGHAETVSREDMRKGCYHLLRGGMGKKAARIQPCYTWEELVLPPGQKRKLRDACNQAACRKKIYETWGFGKKIAYGRGISVIFAGPPGTGKTMAAQVMASELCLDLYRIELPAVVSKYIGETEKNLEEIFEQASKSQVILFFDEADVLFSKRTEVRDSNDKYSNMEAAFLLQKMEEYEGITVLATNFLQNFDEAFKRRMKFIIDFPFPGPEERRQIWKQAFPAEVPVDGELDFDFLAGAFELSGSNIKNSVLHAAFLAAASGEAVSMRHVIAGVRNEFEKSGKILSREQLGQYYMLLEV